MKNICTILTICILSVCSCVPTRPTYFAPLTKYGIKKDSLQDHLSHVQLYNSRRIVLERRISSGQTAIEEGNIVYRDSVWIHQVIIEAETPGENFTPNAPEKYHVGFNAEDKNKFLVFQYNPSYARFMLAFKYEKDSKGRIHPRVQYGEYKFWIMEGTKSYYKVPVYARNQNGRSYIKGYKRKENPAAYLLVEKEQKRAREKQVIKEEGREIN